MNFVWVSILTISLGILMFQSADSAFATLLSGSEKAVELSLKLWAIYAVWLGVLKIVEDTKLDQKISKLLKPIIHKLIGKFDDQTENQIAINLTSNLFGMGNASTPSGMNAIFGMHTKGEKVATSAMIMFFILNTTNLQIIPTTIIGLRILNGSASPNDIILPTLISSFASTFVGVVLVKVISKFKRKTAKWVH